MPSIISGDGALVGRDAGDNGRFPYEQGHDEYGDHQADGHVYQSGVGFPETALGLDSQSMNFFPAWVLPHDERPVGDSRPCWPGTSLPESDHHYRPYSDDDGEDDPRGDVWPFSSVRLMELCY